MDNHASIQIFLEFTNSLYGYLGIIIYGQNKQNLIYRIEQAKKHAFKKFLKLF